jgi:hypothetical protein
MLLKDTKLKISAFTAHYNLYFSADYVALHYYFYLPTKDKIVLNSLPPQYKSIIKLCLYQMSLVVMLNSKRHTKIY